MIKYRKELADTFKGFGLGENVIWITNSCDDVRTEKEGRVIAFDKEHCGLLSILVETEPDFSSYTVHEAIEPFLKGSKTERVLTVVRDVNYDSKCIWLSEFDIVHISNQHEIRIKDVLNNPPVYYMKSTFRSDGIIRPTLDDHGHANIVREEKKKDDKPVSNVKEAVTFEPSSHYEFGNGLNCMDFIIEAVKDSKGIEAFYQANAIKYLFRANKKNGIDDLKKAHNYITLLLKSKGVDIDGK